MRNNFIMEVYNKFTGDIKYYQQSEPKEGYVGNFLIMSPRCL